LAHARRRARRQLRHRPRPATHHGTPHAPSPDPRPPPPAGGGGYAAAATAATEQLHHHLVTTVEHAVGELEHKLHTEALTMVRVLAAAAFQFFAAATGTPGVEREWRRVCRAEQRSIWPGEFDGAEAALSEAVSVLLKRADDVRTGGTEVAAAVGAPLPGRKTGPGQG
ncbi:hypothetical protein ACTAE5_34430, partial [Streptomyces antibioticus]